MEQSPCEAFQKKPDGTWVSIKPTTLKVKNRTIAIPIGMKFTKGEEFMFIDVAQWLEDNCSS